MTFDLDHSQFDHWNAFHSDPELRQLAEDWATTPRPDWTDVDDRLNRWTHDEPDKALALICAVAQIAQGDALESLATGPLENWLCAHAETRMDTILGLAREHDHFRLMVRGVWQNSMPKNFYQKIRPIGTGRL